MIDIRQSPYWALFMEELGWSSVKIGPKAKEQYVYLRQIPILGKILKGPRLQTPLPFTEIDKLALDERVAFAKIEPNSLSMEKTLLTGLENNGYHSERWSLHPTKTITFDLRKSEDEILTNMEKDTRYSIRAAQRRGVRIEKTKDLERFLEIYRQTAKRKKFWIAERELRLLWEIFSKENKAFIMLAQWNKTDVAGCLILHFDKKAYYYHAASISNLRELFAPYLLVWEALIAAKSLGLKEFDLEGVYDPRMPATKNWQGFTHFKKGFHGEDIELIGSFTKTYSLVAKIVTRLGNFSF